MALRTKLCQDDGPKHNTAAGKLGGAQLLIKDDPAGDQ